MVFFMLVQMGFFLLDFLVKKTMNCNNVYWVPFIKVPFIVNDFGSNQVGVAVVRNATCYTTIHSDGEFCFINATKVTHAQCEHYATTILLSSKPLEPLLEANLTTKEKRKKKGKGMGGE